MNKRMEATHCLAKTLPKLAIEMALSVATYNLTRVRNIGACSDQVIKEQEARETAPIQPAQSSGKPR
jgi:hypothetical protein